MPGKFPYAHALIAIATLSGGASPSAAQGFGNPFAAGPGAGLGPYGNGTGASVHLIQLGSMAKAGATAAAIGNRPTRAAAETAEPRHQAELPEGLRLLEAMFIGCSAGAFLGGYTAWSTALPAVGAEVAVAGPPAAGAAAGVLAASAIGCGLGAATAVVTLAAGTVWNWAVR